MDLDQSSLSEQDRSDDGVNNNGGSNSTGDGDSLVPLLLLSWLKSSSLVLVGTFLLMIITGMFRTGAWTEDIVGEFLLIGLPLGIFIGFAWGIVQMLQAGLNHSTPVENVFQTFSWESATVGRIFKTWITSFFIGGVFLLGPLSGFLLWVVVKTIVNAPETGNWVWHADSGLIVMACTVPLRGAPFILGFGFLFSLAVVVANFLVGHHSDSTPWAFKNQNLFVHL